MHACAVHVAASNATVAALLSPNTTSASTHPWLAAPPSVGSCLAQHSVLVLWVGHSTNGCAALEVDQPLLTCRAKEVEYISHVVTNEMWCRVTDLK
jgi:hypothetical protein